MVGMPNYLAYNCSKAAVIELTKSLSLELAPLIRVNCICPGYIMTPMQKWEYNDAQLDNLAAKVPLQKLGQSEDVASLAYFLTSKEAKFITGSCFVVDGGEIAGGLASK